MVEAVCLALSIFAFIIAISVVFGVTVGYMLAARYETQVDDDDFTYTDDTDIAAAQISLNIVGEMGRRLELSAGEKALHQMAVANLCAFLSPMDVEPTAIQPGASGYE